MVFMGGGEVEGRGGFIALGGLGGVDFGREVVGVSGVHGVGWGHGRSLAVLDC